VEIIVFGGIIPFIIVLIAVLAAELVVNRIYYRLGDGQGGAASQDAD
jgi:hypothetical protein